VPTAARVASSDEQRHGQRQLDGAAEHERREWPEREALADDVSALAASGRRQTEDRNALTYWELAVDVHDLRSKVRIFEEDQ